jgi:hypothetical protein
MADTEVVAQLRPAPSKHPCNSLHPQICVLITGVAAAYPFEAGNGASGV